MRGILALNMKPTHARRSPQPRMLLALRLYALRSLALRLPGPTFRQASNTPRKPSLMRLCFHPMRAVCSADRSVAPLGAWIARPSRTLSVEVLQAIQGRSR